MIKQKDKPFYSPGTKPELITIPPMNFFTIKGEGNPNSEVFAERVAVLYALSYGIKMLPKKGITPEGYEPYSVYPLEGVWDLNDEAKLKSFEHLDKDSLVFNLMIRQPDFVTKELATQVIGLTKQKKGDALFDQARFESLTEGLCVQMLHKGPYDDEPASFERMEAFCEENGLIRESKLHREIYLGDPRKTAPEKLRTILRFKVKPAK
ncbi:MAG: GyrI-like domain-containing protein [Clostridia bacterium]|nr:GyrI-like domain-containing protein [Clostridia bacterium]